MSWNQSPTVRRSGCALLLATLIAGGVAIYVLPWLIENFFS